MADLVKQSKFLSLVLRHDPGRIGLQLDPQGWAWVDEIVEKSEIGLTRDRIAQIVRASEKRRFALSGDGSRIRANQGHSIAVDLGLKAQAPPDKLCHGTAEANVDVIRSEGLEKRGRHHGHLSPDTETARRVGMRHGKPFVFEIAAGAMQRDGHAFFVSANGVWLTEIVPPVYLREPVA